MRFLSLNLFFCLLCALPAVGHAESAALEGTWSGSGYLQPKDGQRENVRCRVQYHKETNDVYRVSANCATSSNKVTQTGNILKVGANVYTGEFHNPEFDVSGRIRISVNGLKQTLSLTSGKGSGSMTLSRR